MLLELYPRTPLCLVEERDNVRSRRLHDELLRHSWRGFKGNSRAAQRGTRFLSLAPHGRVQARTRIANQLHPDKQARARKLEGKHQTGDANQNGAFSNVT